MIAKLFQNFVFGYGSLICAKSRSVTVPEIAQKIATPVVVKGIERVWSKRSKTGMTAMGVQFADDSECVGVLLPVTSGELREFDKREQGYDRYRLDLEDVQAVPFLDFDKHYCHPDHRIFLQAKEQNLEDSVRLWVYVQQKNMPPTLEHPIAQSYVDTILRGCLDISEEFAKEFIETTKGWHPEELPDMDLTDNDSDSDSEFSLEGSNIEYNCNCYWVDDRERPIYLRGDPQWSREQADNLDRLLKTYRPNHFRFRKPFGDLTSRK